MEDHMKRLLFSLTLAIAFTAQACNDHELQQPNSALQVVNTTVSTAKAEGPMLVTVIGELKNTTTDKIDSLVLEAKLSDVNGRVIDVLSESMYGLVVPPGEQVSFRLQGAAATTGSMPFRVELDLRRSGGVGQRPALPPVQRDCRAGA
jgi:hypothetical protein